MAQAVSWGLALILGAAVATVMVAAWRRPWLGLPILVAGMAIHNLALMLLLQGDVASLAIRALQLWKEALIALLFVRLGLEAIRGGDGRSLAAARRRWLTFPPVVRLLDAGMAVFAALLLVYVVVPLALGDTQSSLSQRVLELRQLGLLPIMYLLGRVWPPVRLRTSLAPIVVTGSVVAVFGALELLFVPTHTWLDLGILKFDSWLGYSYSGPGGLPENFFTNTSAGLLRRMVSGYLSPLGVAYTGLLVIPAAFLPAVAGGGARKAWLGLALVLVGIGASVTRLALLCVLVEAAVLLALRFSRVAVAAAALVAGTALAGILVYPAFGPVVAYDLSDVRAPYGAQLLGYDRQGAASAGGLSTDVVSRLATGDDVSIQTHITAIENGVEFVLKHPLGVGLGTSVSRYGTATGPGESAIFQVGGDMGIPGLLLFSALYGGVVIAGLWLAWSHRKDWLLGAVGAVVGVGGLALAPEVLTSQIWGDFSVTFLFWWLAGSVITFMARPRPAPQDAAS